MIAAPYMAKLSTCKPVLSSNIGGGKTVLLCAKNTIWPLHKGLDITASSIKSVLYSYVGNFEILKIWLDCWEVTKSYWNVHTKWM